MKLKSLRTFIAREDIPDLRGKTINKGAKIFVMDEDFPIHPTMLYKILLVRVDNGTKDLALMPETAIKEYQK